MYKGGDDEFEAGVMIWGDDDAENGATPVEGRGDIVVLLPSEVEARAPITAPRPGPEFVLAEAPSSAVFAAFFGP